MYVLVTYDVVDGRTESFRKILARYLVHEQKSVFAGSIEQSKLIRLRKELQAAMVPEDSVIEVTAANRNNISVSVLRKAAGNAALIDVDHNHHQRESDII